MNMHLKLAAHRSGCCSQLPPIPQVYEEGTHLMVPWFEHPVIYDVRARPNVIQSTSGSRHLSRW